MSAFSRSQLDPQCLGEADRARVSVVIIFLNAERFLDEAIASVLAQTYTEWELVLVNDGSSDQSGAIAIGYAEAQPARIRYVEHPDGANCGMSASRNLGIHHARAELIAFLDADDVWLPAKLERQVAALDAHPEAAMVYGPTLLWYSWTGAGEDQGKDRLRLLGVTPNQLIEAPALIPLFLRDKALPPSTCGLLVRRSAALRVGGFEDSFRGMYEDQAFLYKLCLREAVWVTEECLDRYRQHGSSATADAEASGWYNGNGPSRAHQAFLDWFRLLALASGAVNNDIAKALAFAYRPYSHPWLWRIDWFYRAVGRMLWKRLDRLWPNNRGAGANF
jgi:glycosyltransferase involved in cell wall biosynthesis